MPASQEKRGVKRTREPSVRVAMARRSVTRKRGQARSKAQATEHRSRAQGGYGKATVSPWDLPPGGIKASPAWRKIVARAAPDAPPPPEKRAGAPIFGGWPVDKWPPNILVDVNRQYWLPDDWGQGLKNTGPGGTYLGWVSPQGKFYYHRKVMELDLGRKLTAKDGFNGIMFQVGQKVKPNADKAFLRQCLTATERKHLLPPSKFHFAVISARRATRLEGTHDIMVVEAHFQQAGVRPTWYVDAESLDAYKALGVKAVVGGKLTPARNLALTVAEKAGQVCVQVSDDIGKWEYFDVKKLNFGGQLDFAKANEAVMGARRHIVTPVAAAQYLLAKMRSSPAPKPQLAGCFPTCNPAQALGGVEFSRHHFILGDFFVVDKSPCRFDPQMTLKEDYDFTCSHLAQHGSVLRCNRLFLSVKHSTNAGGAVTVRSRLREQENIDLLQRKWPGIFHLNGKRQDEVILCWQHYDPNCKLGDSTQFVKLTSKEIPRTAKLHFTRSMARKASCARYMVKRCQRLNGRTVQEGLGMMYRDSNAKWRRLRITDVKYDVSHGLLSVSYPKGSGAEDGGGKGGKAAAPAAA